MNRWIWVVVGSVALVGGGLGVVAAQHQSTIQPNVAVGDLQVGGETPEEARRKIAAWWNEKKFEPVLLRNWTLPQVKPERSAVDLGVDIDLDATIAQLPLDHMAAMYSRRIANADAPSREFPIIYRMVPADYGWLEEAIKSGAPTSGEARAVLRKGIVQHTPEVGSVALDSEKLPNAILTAIQSGTWKAEYPLIPSQKRVPDSALKSIVKPLSSFSTRFPSSTSNRTSNIRLAVQAIDGVVLMPGERFSFNEVVGRRTAANGYKLAGVYINGQKGEGIGGGICQVSSTLYNAALLSETKVAQRTSHGMPVPYVALGRDATVDYGTIDLVLENNFDHPIALSCSVDGTTLTCRVLGPEKPLNDVSIVTEVAATPTGGRVAQTFRVIKRDGQEVRRERVAISRYRSATPPTEYVREAGVGPLPGPSTEPTTATTAEPPPMIDVSGVQSDQLKPPPIDDDGPPAR